jgi:NitT/TauT family transport system permease protein
VSLAALAVAALSAVAIVASRGLRQRAQAVVLPIATGTLLLALWHLWAESTRYEIATPGEAPRLIEVFPTPERTLAALRELIADGRLLRYSISSLFRVTTGFFLAAAVGIPLGLWAGWSTRASYSINPFVQALRPISPLAWIPIATLLFGIKDEAAIFIIFLGAFFPIVTGTMTAVRSMPVAYVRAAHNFGLRKLELVQHVVFPAALPQIITSLRIALGVGWLVIVAAEMNAIQSGLGFLIVDARNMGMRYDLVVAAMLVIGAIGIALDFLVRRLERFDSVRWGFTKE